MGYDSRLSRRREQALGKPMKPTNETPPLTQPENCRWLFGQEVQIITFTYPPTRDYVRVYAAVLPKSCSLGSLARDGSINEKILFRSEWTVDSMYAINSLLEVIEKKKGEILQPDSDGGLRIEESAIPEKCKMMDTALIEPVEPSIAESITQTTSTTSELDETGIVTPSSGFSDFTVQPEETSEQAGNLLEVATRRLEDVQKTFSTLEKTITEQEEKIKRLEETVRVQGQVISKFKRNKEDKDIQIITLKKSLHEAESARDTEFRARVQVQTQLEKEILRAKEREARESDTNAILERLLKTRVEATSVRSSSADDGREGDRILSDDDDDD